MTSNNPEHTGTENRIRLSPYEKVLGVARSRVIDAGYNQYETAMARPGDFLRSSPVAIPDYPDALACMLTRDGTRPYQDELATKPHYIVYVSPSLPPRSRIWYDYHDGLGRVVQRDVSLLDSGTPPGADEFEDEIKALLHLSAESFVEESVASGEEDAVDDPSSPEDPPRLTEYEQLRLDQERFERWLGTDFSAEADAA